MRRSATLLAFLLLCGPAVAGVVTLEAAHDATLIEHPEGALANGSGFAFFVGRTGQPEHAVRRALVRFDVASALPDRAIIESVSLTLFMTPSNTTPSRIGLHRVLADWGEGASSSAGGSGAPAQNGDVTWLHRFWDTTRWAKSGGQFVERTSADLEVTAFGAYTWTSTQHLVQDVRQWNEAPQRNFGWILIGDETTPQSSKSFASREDPNPSLRPVLEIVYRLPGEDSGAL